MAQLPDIVRDFELEAQFVPDPSVQTIHTYRESDLESGRRLVTRKEHWQRQRKIGSGSFGSVWLEKCIQETRSVQFRAVKQLPIHDSVDYRRELEAITRFSHPKVRPSHLLLSNHGLKSIYDSTITALPSPLGGTKHRLVSSSPWNISSVETCQPT